jgi:SAM-dependent methyltransferase
MIQSLRGIGIEIGAFNKPLLLPPDARVKYADIYPEDAARRYFPEGLSEGEPVPVHIVAPADRLDVIPNASQDFIVASHLLEHMEDPIGALLEWHRVLRPGGLLFLRVPDMRGTFDRLRTRTSLEHLVLDHAESSEAAGRRARDLDHYCEWARCVNNLVDEGQVRFWAGLLQRARYPIHFHCWLPEDVTSMVSHMNAEGSAGFELLHHEGHPEHYEFASLYRRTTPEASGS